MTETDQMFGEFENYVIGLSYSCSGFIIVELESDNREVINEATLDDIYKMLDDYCENEGVSDVPVVFMWSHQDESISLPDYGPHIFEEAKREPTFIAARGTMPVITDEGGKREWTDKLVECSRGTTEIDRYFYDSGGPLLSFGTSINGYLEVGCNSATPEKVNSTVIDEIYSMIDAQSKKVGVNDVPVVFVWAEVPTEDTPGFTSTMLILSILLLAGIRRKLF